MSTSAFVEEKKRDGYISMSNHQSTGFWIAWIICNGLYLICWGAEFDVCFNRNLS